MAIKASLIADVLAESHTDETSFERWRVANVATFAGERMY